MPCVWVAHFYIISKATKAKRNKWDYRKINSFRKEINHKKREKEKILTSPTSNNDLISKF